ATGPRPLVGLVVLGVAHTSLDEGADHAATDRRRPLRRRRRTRPLLPLRAALPRLLRRRRRLGVGAGAAGGPRRSGTAAGDPDPRGGPVPHLRDDPGTPVRDLRTPARLRRGIALGVPRR